MKLSKLIKLEGMLAIANKCDNNLSSIRQFFIRECNLPKGYDLSRTLKRFEELLQEKVVFTSKSELLCEILRKI
ncbi:hypothetical protein IKU74_04355 [bacterium]|nr:hypothetical protein [bacterium]